MSSNPVTEDGTIRNFDPHVATSMDKQEPPAPGDDFRLVFVGAGNINFGCDLSLIHI